MAYPSIYPVLPTAIDALTLGVRAYEAHQSKVVRLEEIKASVEAAKAALRNETASKQMACEIFHSNTDLRVVAIESLRTCVCKLIEAEQYELAAQVCEKIEGLATLSEISPILPLFDQPK